MVMNTHLRNMTEAILGRDHLHPNSRVVVATRIQPDAPPFGRAEPLEGREMKDLALLDLPPEER